MVRTILIFADANRRAAITSVRILSQQRVKLLFAINEEFPKRLTNMIFKRYMETPLLKYSSTSFISFLNETKKQYGNYSILPIGEWQIRQILENRHELLQGIDLCINDLEVYERLSNKKSFINICADFDIKVPSELSSFPTSFTYSFVIKPKSYDSNSNVLKYPLLVDSEESFNQVVNLNLDLLKHFVQEFILGPSVYYCAFYKKGCLINNFSQLNTVQQPNGKSVLKAEPFSLSDELSEKINLLFGKLKWTGPMMFELKRCDASGVFYAIECNPRLWGPLQISADNGVDFVSPCFDLDPILPNTSVKWGYFWLSGYISGYLLKKLTKQNFQKFKPTANINYRELFWRNYSRKYFIFDFLFQCKELIKYYLSSSGR